MKIELVKDLDFVSVFYDEKLIFKISVTNFEDMGIAKLENLPNINTKAGNGYTPFFIEVSHTKKIIDFIDKLIGKKEITKENYISLIENEKHPHQKKLYAEELGYLDADLVRLTKQKLDVLNIISPN